MTTVKVNRNELVREIKTEFEGCFAAGTVTLKLLSPYAFKLTVDRELSWETDKGAGVHELILWLIRLSNFQNQLWDEDFKNGIIVKGIVTILFEAK